MRKKKLLVVLLVLMLILPSFLIHAAAPTQNESSEEEVEKVAGDGDFAYKDEVVYANLNATGEVDEVYVVNIFEVTKQGIIIDEGNYSEVKNLTDLSNIDLENNKVTINASKGKFYYQGNIQDKPKLPWDIQVSYYLDGNKVKPEELAGKNGRVAITIETTANNEVDSVFYENYLLQISLLLNSNRFSNINAPDAMIANAGKNKQLTFTVMPESDETFTIEADVTDFEFDGIDIAAIPSTMSIDIPDTDEMTKEMDSLTDAIKQLNDGVKDLSDGVSELNKGVAELRDGSSQFNDGLNELSDASSDIVDASSQIDEVLELIASSLPDNLDNIDVSQFSDLAEGLREMASGLNDISSGLTELHGGFSMAYDALDEAINTIPEAIADEDLQKLMASNMSNPENMEVLNKLIEQYTAAQTVKRTYQHTQGAFMAMDLALPNMIAGLEEMELTLNQISNQISGSLDELDQLSSLSELKDGLSQLSTNYGEFHAGLSEYTGGVDLLSNSYNEMHSGIKELSSGTEELDRGVKELRDGTGQLYEATSDLPNQLQEEIDRIVSDFDKSDVEVKSFTSPNNHKINSVQFVIKTESIKKVEEEVKEVVEKEEKGFWQKFWDLFR